MLRYQFLALMTLMYTSAYCQVYNPIEYCGRIESPTADSLRNREVLTAVRILGGDTLAYEEQQRVFVDSSGRYCVLIGRGNPVFSHYDSILWSFGSYYLELSFRDSRGRVLKHETAKLIRSPEELGRRHITGSHEGTGSFGDFSMSDSGRGKPRRVVVDMSSTYVNKAYPADTYPVHRHFEWFDENLDGLGNAFTVSFSENTRNYFVENTPGLGHITLYASPFQQVLLETGQGRLTIRLTRPVPLISHGVTYEIRGPWTLYYYFEW